MDKNGSSKPTRAIKMNAGRSLRVALAKKDMTQQDLAKQMKVSSAYVSRLANAEHIGMGTVVSLSEFFGMKPSEFLALGED